MLTSLFFGGSAIATDSGISELGLGGRSEITRLNQSPKQAILKRVELPGAVSADDVVKATGEASGLEASAQLLRDYARQQQRAANAIAQMYQTQAQHKKAMMGINNRLQRVDVGHQKAVAQHGLISASNNAEVRGWMGAYQSAKSAIGF